MLNMWRAIAAEEEQSSAPIVQPTNKSLRDERRADMPLLDEWYGMVAQPTQRGAPVHPSYCTAPAVIGIPCCVSSSIFVVRHSSLAARTSCSLSPSSPGGLCHSPAGLPVYPDWAKLQQRYLPSKSVEEIRKRFHNVRSKEADEQHPLKRVKLHAGASGAKHDLDDEGMAVVEAALKDGGRGTWAQLCRTSFAGWDRRTLKRTYDKCKRARELASGGMKAETSNIEPSSPPSIPSRPPPALSQPPARPPTSSAASAPPTVPPSAPSLDAGSGTKSVPVSAVMCDGGVASEVQWSKHSDRQLLLFARQHGLVVEQWPYAAVSALQATVAEAADGTDASAVSIVAISARLTMLLKLIAQQRQQPQPDCAA